MVDLKADIVVIGAGFSGSLLSLLLKRIGRSCVLIDRGTHPRFAIGESSTPMANLILEDLARRYDLPRIAPLASYGTWKRVHPEIVCGLKRGFSYFHHTLGQDFRPRSDHANELLVAASAGADDADTHWLRSDFDQFLADEAVGEGVPYFDLTTLESPVPHGLGWELRGHRQGEPLTVVADLIVDASGDGGFVARHLGIGPHPDGLQTRSRALFSHFTNVKRWQDLYVARGGSVADHPYPCDDAALHHVFDGGWMWILPFDNGVTSAGFSLDPDQFPLDKSVSPQAEWDSILSRLPAVAEQFADAIPIVPWRQTGRMQRRLARSTGPNWVMLPNTATFLDPLHSTGNALTLVGIERLVEMLEGSWRRPDWINQMQRYDDLLQQETGFLDLIVSGSFKGFREFERMIALSMFYFSAATWSEAERREERAVRGSAFLSADHPDLKGALIQSVSEIGDPRVPTSEFVARIRQAIGPFNRVGLCEPTKLNLYGV
ncbi:MAG: tryptophan 7-halogenase [Planctomycetes bacterium]|nr:tryptophan 7-halogenase [Planctomycetota bacterium]